MPPQLLPYWRFRNDLSTIDGVLMYGSRAIIPPKLRSQVLSHLHSAHQGTSQMNNRAANCVFWPGISSDIEEARARCNPCDIIAPSNPKLPLAEPYIPTSPFEAIASDFFQFKGTACICSLFIGPLTGLTLKKLIQVTLVVLMVQFVSISEPLPFQHAPKPFSAFVIVSSQMTVYSCSDEIILIHSVYNCRL